MRLLNVSFYRFTRLTDPRAWKARLESQLSSLDVKGTLLLAEEGLNGFLAGPVEAVRAALAILEAHPEFKGLWTKESFSGFVPFRKLAVKVKKEIVTFRVPGHSPLEAEAPRLSPAELAEWYERGEEFSILDTRNVYEARLGKFVGAEVLPIGRFADFPAAVEKLPPEWKKRKIVTYCTGGIRCEKAAPFLRAQGFENVYQLDGGILHYFEQMGGKHWEGECFVFDDRIALGPDLEATGARLCEKCQGPIPQTAASCPHCGA